MGGLTDRERGHFSRAAYTTLGATEPIASRPSSVRTAVNAVPASNRPDPQEPDTFGNCCRKAWSWSSAPGLDPVESSVDISVITTVVQPSPTTFGSWELSGVGRFDSSLSAFGDTSVTSAPGGGVNVKSLASG